MIARKLFDAPRLRIWLPRTLYPVPCPAAYRGAFFANAGQAACVTSASAARLRNSWVHGVKSWRGDQASMTTPGAQPLRQASAATEQNRLRLLGDLGKRARKEPKPRGRRRCELQDGTHRRHGCRVETTSTHMPLLHIPLLHSESRRRLLGASGFAFSQRAPREGDRHVPA
jgi:hypothetical protein